LLRANPRIKLVPTEETALQCGIPKGEILHDDLLFRVKSGRYDSCASKVTASGSRTGFAHKATGSDLSHHGGPVGDTQSDSEISSGPSANSHHSESFYEPSPVQDWSSSVNSSMKFRRQSIGRRAKESDFSPLPREHEMFED